MSSPQGESFGVDRNPKDRVSIAAFGVWDALSTHRYTPIVDNVEAEACMCCMRGERNIFLLTILVILRVREK